MGKLLNLFLNIVMFFKFAILGFNGYNETQCKIQIFFFPFEISNLTAFSITLIVPMPVDNITGIVCDITI